MSAGQRDERSPSKEHTSTRIQMQSSNRLEGLLERPVSGVLPMLLLLLLLPSLAPSSPRSSTDSKLQLCEGTLKQILASHRGCDMRAPFVERTPYPQIRKPGCGLEHRALTAAGVPRDAAPALKHLARMLPKNQVVCTAFPNYPANTCPHARLLNGVPVNAGAHAPLQSSASLPARSAAPRLPHNSPSAWDGLACLTG